MSRLSAVSAALVATVGVACASREPAPRAAAPPTVAAAPSPPATPEPAPATTVAAADVFQTQVRPVLARRCTPCHVPGGRMYERLPFDDAETVRGNRAGILRRLDGEDKAAVERWLSES